MKNLLFVAGMSLVSCLGGCVSLGISQQDQETAYTVAAIGSDIAIKTGKVTPDVVGNICSGDALAYDLMIAGRNVGDNVNYKPADLAHYNVQHDGAKLAPAQCTELPPV